LGINKTGQIEKAALAGCWKTPLCCVALILRHCDVLERTPHSSGFCAPCICMFLNSLGKLLFKQPAKKIA